jgi:LuxR family transcriptional regulator, maltose regulon positive regulatory protein
MVQEAASVPPITPLTVHTLGYFAVWRGETRLEEKAWGREKARQLFQYLVTHRRRFILKERIVDDLWPELDSGRADRDFKVALNALNMARQGTSYGLSLEAPIEADIDAFEAGLTAGSQLASHDRPQAITCYRHALDHYQGDYLPDALYDDWASAERERLTTLYLAGSTRLAALLLQEGEALEATVWCQRVISLDRCWEEAYRLLMRGHMTTGNRPLSLRVYQQCRRALEEELAIEPMVETTRLYEQIIAGEIPPIM